MVSGYYTLRTRLLVCVKKHHHDVLLFPARSMWSHDSRLRQITTLTTNTITIMICGAFSLGSWAHFYFFRLTKKLVEKVCICWLHVQFLLLLRRKYFAHSFSLTFSTFPLTPSLSKSLFLLPLFLYYYIDKYIHSRPITKTQRQDLNKYYDMCKFLLFFFFHHLGSSSSSSLLNHLYVVLYCVVLNTRTHVHSYWWALEYTSARVLSSLAFI